MVVVLLLVLIWAVVLVPPAARFHAARQEAFLVSLAPESASQLLSVPRHRSQRIQRRRRIAGGLLLAMAVTLVVGLLPTFRVLLVVHLFLLDSFLGYIALLAHTTNRSARGLAREPSAVAAARRPRGRRRALLPRPSMLPDLGPIAPAS